MNRDQLNNELENHYGGEIPAYVAGAGNGYIDIMVREPFWDDEGKESKRRIYIEDVVRYYAGDARNISSGMRTLGGITGDWRPINNLAEECLAWFKRVNVEGIKAQARKFGITFRG